MSTLASLLLLLILGEILPIEVHIGAAKIEGLGEIALPPGKWELELTEKAGKNYQYDVWVLKKQGDRLERLSFQRVPPKIAGRLGNYFDSIGDSFSNGAPKSIKQRGAHDTAHIIQPLRVFRLTEGKETGMTSSYIYTDELHDEEKGNVPWMSHARVTDEGGAVIISVHASPFVLSPDTIAEVVSDSKFEKPIAESSSPTSDKAK